MATITTRSGKGSPLTNTEVDNNFTNLNTAKYESGDNVSLGSGSFSSSLTLGSNPSNPGVLQLNDNSTTGYYLRLKGTGTRGYQFQGSSSSGNYNLSFTNENEAGGFFITTYGGATFNEGSIDQDFRVESNNNAYMLFVDASSDTVSIGTSANYQKLTVAGAIQAGSESQSTGGGAGMYMSYYGSNDDYIANFGAKNSSGGPALNYGVVFNSSGQMVATYDNFEGAKSSLANNGRDVKFWSTPVDDQTASGSVIADGFNEYFSLGRNGFIFNEDSKDVDFRVESDTNANGLFFDASASALGINKLPDSNGYYALDIDGIIRQNGATVSGIVYPYRGTVTRALNAPTEWFKIYTVTSASSRIVRMRIQHGGDNTNFMGEFVFNMAGYSFAHSISLENYTYYNGPQLLEVFTRTVSNTTLEIWAKVEALTSYAGSFNIYSNDGNVIASPTAVSSEPTGINARLRSTHWPGSTNRTSAAWSDAINLSNASPINFYRSDDTRYSRIYHDNSGMVLETQNSGDNIYIRNSSGTTGNVFIDNGENGYSVVVNDSSLNTDFRVETDSKTHGLYVDASTNRVGIMNSSPASTLDVDGTIRSANFHKQWTAKSTPEAWRRICEFGGGGVYGGSFMISLKGTRGNVVFRVTALVDYSHSAKCSISILGGGTYTPWKLRAVVTSNGQGYLELREDGSDTYYDSTNGQDVACTAITTDFSTSVTPITTLTSGETIPSGYYERGLVDGTAKVTFGNEHFGVGEGVATFNENGTDRDFRVESDANSNMFLVDGGASRIGVNTGTPASILHVAEGSGGCILSMQRTNNNSTGTVGGVAFLQSDGYPVATVAAYGSASNNGAHLEFKTASSNSSDTNYHTGTTTRMRVTAGGSIDTTQPDNATFVVNEGSASVDFRVESNDDTNALWVDGSANKVGVRASTLYHPLTIGTGVYIGSGFTQVNENYTNAQVVIGGAHNAGFNSGAGSNSTGHTKLLITGVDNDNPTYRVKYIRCEDENGKVHFDLYGGTDGANATDAYGRFNADLYFDWNIGSAVGSITRSSSGVTYATTSDRRLKENIETITDGTAKVMAMNPVTHTWIADKDAPAVHGFIAQEMQGVVPEAVTGDPEGEEMMSMDYGRITPVLVAALQDAHKKIAELETRLTELEGK